MTKERFTMLLQLYYEDKLPADQLQEFLDATQDPAYQHEFEAYIDQGLQSGQFKGASSHAQARKVLSRIKLQGAGQRTSAIVIWYQKRSYFAGAAVVLLATLLLVFYLLPPSHSSPAVATNHGPVDPLYIAPGSSKATLTLADGQTVLLDGAARTLHLRQGQVTLTTPTSGELYYSAGADQTDQPIIYNTVTTPRGGTYGLRLPDGTRVWLNADSKITYPTAFGLKARNVQVSGEAFFEVAANPHSPFTVTAAGCQIAVLGTAFNIRAYPDHAGCSTTLLQGKVIVSAAGKSRPLTPGLQVDIDGAGRWQEKMVDTTETVAWKNGLFDFHSTALSTIMSNLEKWYDIHAEFKDGMGTKRFTGKFSRAKDASEMLHIMEANDMHVELHGKTLVISR